MMIYVAYILSLVLLYMICVTDSKIFRSNGNTPKPYGVLHLSSLRDTQEENNPY